MKLASYIADGKEAYAVVTGDGVITMNDRLGGHATSLREALAGDMLSKIGVTAGRTVTAVTSTPDIKFLPVIPNPEKILCVGIDSGNSMPPSTAPRTPSGPTSLRASSTRWWHMRARCCGRRCRPASISRASWRW